MKVLILNGSSHQDGTTMQAVKEMVKTFENENIGTEVFQIGGAPVADCIACGKCEGTGMCAFNDSVNEFIEKAKKADGFVFATPVYYAHPTGRILSFLDRAFYAGGEAFRFKPGASVTVARRGGTTASFDCLNKYFGIAEMPIAGSTYWNNVHGREAADALKDEEGLQTMRNLARNMTWMMRCFAEGKTNGIPYPKNEYTACTDFIRGE